MSNITIIDEDYKSWLQELSQRYRRSQIKAAVRVNSEMLRYYWSLGRDIVMLKAESRWGDKFMQNLSRDMKALLPEAKCFSETNLKYMRYFYELYPLSESISPQLGDEMSLISPQLGDELGVDIFSVPWGHHKLLIDKYKNDRQIALFYCRKTIENGWSRDMLVN